MIINGMTKRQLEKACEEILHNNNVPVVEDSEKVSEAYEGILRLSEKENEIMIDQNEKQRTNEVDSSCFETANKGFKIFQKYRRK